MAGELAVAGGYSAEQIDLIKTQICKGATDAELKMFLMVCQRSGLDPFARQVHAVKRWNAKTQREELSIQTGIDGFRLIAERTGKYAGNDDPVYDTEDGPRPNKATVTVWKTVGGQRVPFSRSARWNEFVQTTKDGAPTKFWAKMPYLMLGKVAEALALRAAFPQELSGLYTADEMGQADNDAADAHAAERHHQTHQPTTAKALPPKPPEVVEAEVVETTRHGWDAAAVEQAVKQAGECQSAGEIEAHTQLVDVLVEQGKVGDQIGRVQDAWYAKALRIVREAKDKAELEAVRPVFRKAFGKRLRPDQLAGLGEAIKAKDDQLTPPPPADVPEDPF